MNPDKLSFQNLGRQYSAWPAHKIERVVSKDVMDYYCVHKDLIFVSFYVTLSCVHHGCSIHEVVTHHTTVHEIVKYL